MRLLLLFVPALLVAQAPVTKPAPAKPRPAALKPAAAKPATAKAKAAAKPATPAPVVLATDDEKSIYALGLSLYRSLGQFDLSPHEFELVKRALADAAAGKPAVDLNDWKLKIGPLARDRSARVAERQKVVSAAYMVKAAAEPGAIRTESGLIYRETRAGSGDSPKATDTVKVQYRGTLVDGTEFDSSYRRAEPAQFALNGVISCWTEGVQKMKPGGKAVLVCPASLAYGDQGRPSIPGGAALIFEIELLEIVAAQK
jgi:FKBP-type peptidyl-prolyl cis-trans isomerase FkpA